MVSEIADHQPEVRREDALRALDEIREAARVNGLLDMPPDAIDAEIQKTRGERDGLEDARKRRLLRPANTCVGAAW